MKAEADPTLWLHPTPGPTFRRPVPSTLSREESMADEPRDQKPKIRLSQLSHGAG